MSTSPTDRVRRIDGIFDAAVDIPPGEQTAFLNRECALGEAVLAQGRADEALPIVAGAVAETHARYGAKNWRTAEAQLTYGEALAALAALRRHAEAGPALRTARGAIEEHRRTHPRLAARAAAAVARLPG